MVLALLRPLKFVFKLMKQTSYYNTTYRLTSNLHDR